MKKFLTTRNILLIIILLMAGLLRLWDLTNVPPSASLDEASIGYNAYSIVKTGKDEYGVFPFVSHRAYDDWRRAMHLYFVIPAVALFDLNVIAVRIPAVILSLLTVWASYYIALQLFLKRTIFSECVGFITSFLLAISPWHIYLSRLGHESNSFLSFFVFGLLFFLKSENSNRNLILACIFFILSIISYPAGQAFIPLFGLGLIFIFRKRIIAAFLSDKKLLIAMFILLVITIPIIKSVLSPEAMLRFKGTSAFAPGANGEEFSRRVGLRNKAVENNDIIGTIIYNRRFFPVQIFLDGYFAHYNPQWLFMNNSQEPHKVPNLGLMYIWQFPFIIVGVIFIIFTRTIDQKIKMMIFIGLLFIAIPGAITTQAPHAMRVYPFVLIWQIFTACGIAYFYLRLRKLRWVFISGFLLLLGFSLQAFYKNYFIVFPTQQSSSFQYALHDAIKYVNSEDRKYKTIVFSNKDNLYQSYMFFLFDYKYDPNLYLQQGGTKSGGYAESHKFDKYEFRPVNFQKEEIQKGVLYVVNSSDVLDTQSVVKTFKNLDGTEAIKILSK